MLCAVVYIKVKTDIKIDVCMFKKLLPYSKFCKDGLMTVQ